jgi:hypothetical protein
LAAALFKNTTEEAVAHNITLPGNGTVAHLNGTGVAQLLTGVLRDIKLVEKEEF